MGFYGKINNNNATQFVIDRIYPNRWEMEEALRDQEEPDGVFIGRYVLIEYGHSLTQLFKKIVQVKNDKGELIEEDRFYFSRLMSEESRAKFLAADDSENYYKKNYVKENQVIYVLSEELKQEYYKCSGQDENGYAVFEKQAEDFVPSTQDVQQTYYDNYLTDLKYYPDSKRGYDSTVWQKIFVDEKEKYVMIAELNSVVPTFDLTIDAPTTTPIVPHFDADSTNVYYRLHVQPQWGFKVKPASDPKFQDEYVYYTENIYNPVTKEEEKKTTEYFGDIYYNKAGFDPEVRTYDDNTQNKISVLPTGKSGQKYNTHNPSNPTETEEKVDIQQLSILLPSLGNTISDIWDKIYGEVELDENGNPLKDENNNYIYKKERNLDICWDSTKGLRLTNKDSGYAYNETAINTLAGCINTTHDLIGMLVKDDINDIDKADTKNIYYGDFSNNKYNSYYIKSLFYNYSELTGEELEEWIKQINPIELVEFSDGIYYTKTNEGYKRDITKKYQEGTSYYSIKAEDIELEGTYAPNKYYYLNENNLNYLLDGNIYPNENIQYYDIEFIPKTTLSNAQIQTYFYNPKPHISNEDGTWTGYFYEIAEGQIDELVGDGNDPEYNQEAKYYIGYNYTFEMKYVENDDGIKVLTKVCDFGENNERLSPINFIPFTYNSSDKTGNYYFKNNNNEYICLTSKEDVDDSISYGKLALSPKLNKFYEPNLYYYKSGDDFIFSTSETMDTNKSYVVLSGHEEPLTHTFYQPNKYYYKDNLAIDRLDTNLVMTPNREYFIKYFAYVLEDTRGILEKGAEWNSNVKNIPKEITLAKREEYWGWKELIGFGKDLNTIIGLIIRINNLIKFDDFDTRDNHTVQGCINVMNDIINTFGTLIPGEILIVDEYGRVTSSDYSTKQIFNYENYGTKEITENSEEIEDIWINLDINNDPKDHFITLTHNFTKIDSTETISDKNKIELAEGETAGINHGLSDVLNLYTPIVDTTGHVVGHNEETVTLPYGFKFVTTGENEVATAGNVVDTLTINTDEWLTATADSNNNILFNHEYPKAIDNTTSNTDLNNNIDTIVLETLERDEKGHVIKINQETVTLPYSYKTFTSTGISSISNSDIYGETNGEKPIVNKTQTIADNTQDVLEINPANKWIQTKIENDKLAIAHEIHSIDKTNKNTTNLNDPLVDSITIQDLEFDEAGHNTKNQKHTYTLPFGYKTLQDSNELVGKTIATNTQDALTLKGDSWIKPTISQGQIAYTHIGPVVGEYDSKNNVTPKFGDTFTIEDWYFDSKGHKHSKNSHTVMIPKGSLTDVTASGSDLITQLSFTPESGALNTSRANLSSLKLAGYVKETSNSNIAAEDTLAQALSKLQTQIIEEKNARNESIANLDMAENASTTQFISSIKQENGKVAVERAAAGTLNLGNGYSVASENGAISSADSINSAFGKLEYKLNILNSANTVEGSVAYQIAQIVNENNNGNIDTLNEIAAWIINDTTGAANMSNRISSLEGLVGEKAVNTQITEAIEAKNLGQYALNSSLENLEDRVGAIEEKDESWDNGLERITALEDLIDADKVAVWDKAEENVQADWNTIDETADSFILNKPDLSNIVETTTEFSYNYNETTTLMTLSSLMEYIATLEARIYALENPTVEEESEVTPEESGNENIE